MFIYFLSYLILLIILLTYLVKKSTEGISINLSFVFWFAFFYVLMPTINCIYVFYDDRQFPVSDLLFRDTNIFIDFSTLSVTVIAIISYFFGLIFRGNNMKIVNFSPKILEFNRCISFSLPLFSSCFIAVVAFFSIFIYASQFGGIFETIAVTNMVRSGYLEDVAISTQFVFTKRFIYMSVVAFILIYLSGNKTGICKFFLLLAFGSLIFSRILMFSSKESIINIILLFYFYMAIKNRKYYFSFLLSFFALIFLFLPIFDSLLALKNNYNDFNIEIKTNGFEKFVEYFTFPQVSLFFSLNNNYELFYFSDYISNLKGNFLPKSWLPSFTRDITELNTYFFTGEFKRQVPPGFIASSFYSGGVLGVILIPFLYGLLVSYLDSFFKQIIKLRIEAILTYSYIITMSFTLIRTGSPGYTLYQPNTFILIVFFVFFFSYETKRLK